MGQYTSSHIVYSEFVGEEKPGETRVLRNPLVVDKPLRKVNHFGTQTLWDTFENTTFKRKHKDFPCLGTRAIVNGKLGNYYTWKTYGQIYEESLNFSKGITSLKLWSEINSTNGIFLKLIGIYSKNREEWVVSDLGCHANSISVVPIYDTLGDIAIEYILKQTKLTTIIIGSEGLPKIIQLLKSKRCHQLANLVLFDSSESAEKELKELNINVYHYKDILNKGKNSLNVTLEKAKPETILTICFTSGTTSEPKGAMISHGALMSEIDILESAEFKLLDGDVYISFLPLAHMMERLIVSLIFGYGIAIGFYSGHPRNIMDDCRVLKPTCMCSVPKIFQRTYDQILASINKSSPIKRNLFFTGLRQKLDDFHKTGNVKNIFWDNLVFNKAKQALGGRIRFMLTGSAPMAVEIVEFLKVVFSTVLIEGYGQTEDCCGMLLSNAKDNIAGHTGGPGFANEVKLVDIPELGYTSKTINPENGVLEPSGEICIRGPVLFSGYLNDLEKTNEALDSDGWLHTGDVGQILINHGNAIRVVDRVKNIFKLSQGEYVAPEKLENILEKNKYVNQIWVYGDSYQSYVIGFVVPEYQQCIEFLKTKNIICDKSNVIDNFDNEDLKKEIFTELTKLSKENDFKGFEYLKKIHLCKYGFRVDNELSTPTGKIKRHNAKKFYKNEIDKMYAELNEELNAQKK